MIIQWIQIECLWHILGLDTGFNRSEYVYYTKRRVENPITIKFFFSDNLLIILFTCQKICSSFFPRGTQCRNFHLNENRFAGRIIGTAQLRWSNFINMSNTGAAAAATVSYVYRRCILRVYRFQFCRQMDFGRECLRRYNMPVASDSISYNNNIFFEFLAG